MRTVEEYVALGKAFELFLSSQRIRMLGSANLGAAGYQHFGIEIWTQYKDFPEGADERDRRLIYKYILGMAGKSEGELSHAKVETDDLPTLEDVIAALGE